MLILRANLDDLEVVTGSAADIEVHLSAMQADASTPPIVQPAPNLGPLASITTATTTQILDTSGITSGHIVNVKGLSIFNNHASQACQVTVQVNDGTVVTILAGMDVNLLAGESLLLTQGGVAIHYDVNGGVYPSVGNAASQAEMEAGTATDKYVSPGVMKFHPGVCKARGKFGVTGNTIEGWNVDSPTDNGTGDITVNVTTDLSTANGTAQVTVEMTATTYAVANARTSHIRFGGQAAGTLRCDCIDGTATTQLVKDPTAWHVGIDGDFA